MRTMFNAFRGKHKEEELRNASENLHLLVEDHAREQGIYSQYSRKNRKGEVVVTPFNSPIDSIHLIEEPVESKPVQLPEVVSERDSKKITFNKQIISNDDKTASKSKIPILNKQMKSVLKKQPATPEEISNSNSQTSAASPSGVENTKSDSSIGEAQKSKFKFDATHIKALLGTKPNMYNIVREKVAKDKQVKFIRFNQEVKKRKRMRPLVIERQPTRDYQKHPYHMNIIVGPDKKLEKMIKFPVASIHAYDKTATAAEKLGLINLNPCKNYKKTLLKKKLSEADDLVTNHKGANNEREITGDRKKLRINSTIEHQEKSNNKVYADKKEKSDTNDEEMTVNDETLHIHNYSSEATESEIDYANDEEIAKSIETDPIESSDAYPVEIDSTVENFNTEDIDDRIQFAEYEAKEDEEDEDWEYAEIPRNVLIGGEEDLLYLIQENGETEPEENEVEGDYRSQQKAEVNKVENEFEDIVKIEDDVDESDNIIGIADEAGKYEDVIDSLYTVKIQENDEETDSENNNDYGLKTERYIKPKGVIYEDVDEDEVDEDEVHENKVDEDEIDEDEVVEDEVDEDEIDDDEDEVDDMINLVEDIYNDTIETDPQDDIYESMNETNYALSQNEEESKYEDTYSNKNIKITMPSDTSEYEMDQRDSSSSGSDNNFDKILVTKVDESDSNENESETNENSDSRIVYATNATKSRTSGDFDSGFVNKYDEGTPFSEDSPAEINNFDVENESEYSKSDTNSNKNIVTLSNDEDEFYTTEYLPKRFSGDNVLKKNSQSTPLPKKVSIKHSDMKYEPSGNTINEEYEKPKKDNSDHAASMNSYHDVIAGSETSDENLNSRSAISESANGLPKRNNRVVITVNADEGYAVVRSDEKFDSGMDESEDQRTKDPANDDSYDETVSETDEENDVEAQRSDSIKSEFTEEDLKSIYNSLETIIGNRSIKDIAIAIYAADGKPFEAASYLLLDVVDKTNDKFLGTMWLPKKKFEYADSKGFFKQMLTTIILSNEPENVTLNETEQILTIKTPRPGVDKTKKKKKIKENDCKSIMKLIAKINNNEIASEVGIQYLFNLSTFYDMRIIAKPDYTDTESIYIITFMDNKNNKLGTIKLSATEILLIIQRNKQIARYLKIQINDSEENVDNKRNNDNTDRQLFGASRVLTYFRNFFR